MESKGGVGSKVLLIFLLGSLGAALPGKVAAQQEPLTVTRLVHLEFGRILSDPLLDGAVVINPETGLRTLSGGALALGEGHSRAEYVIRGKGQRKFIITLPAGEVWLSTNIGTVKLTNFTSFPSATGRIGPDGTATVYVGATLTVGANQSAGYYSVSFPIFVDYGS